MGGFLGVKKFRERKNMLANQLAKALNVSNAVYSNWENGKRDPSFEVVQKLFEMGATVEELFGIEYESKIAQKIKRYAEKINNLSKANQEKTVMLAELRKVIMQNGSDYANEYVKMIEAEEKRDKLDEEIELTDDKAEKEAKMQEYKTAVESYERSRKRVQELQMQDSEEQMKAGNYSESSEIRMMIKLKSTTAKSQSCDLWEDETEF